MKSCFATGTVGLALALALNLGAGLCAADEPTKPTTPATTPETTTTNPSSSSSTSTEHKPATTGIFEGKVVKVSPTSITVKGTYKIAVKPGAKTKVHTVHETHTYEIVETPPVKIVTGGDKPTRTPGSYSDVKAGDTVEVGIGPHSVPAGDGKVNVHTRVTGIDVFKHSGDSTTVTTSKKNKQ